MSPPAPSDDPQENEPDSLPCATANVLEHIPRGESGAISRKGTKHFRGGAKVYLIDYYPGMCEAVVVIGHHRSSGRYIELTMRAKDLNNFRMTTVYSPKVLKLIRECYSKAWEPYSEAHARRICESALTWAEEARKPRQSIPPDANQPSS